MKRVNVLNEYLNLKHKMMLLLLKTPEKIFYLIVKHTLVQKLDSIKGVKPSDIVVSKVIHNSIMFMKII
jgi:rod shape-determining protein MreC